MSKTVRRELAEIIDDEETGALIADAAYDRAYYEQRRREEALWERRKAATPARQNT